MSSGEVKKVSREDIQLVQNLIERCLQLYMNQKEVVSTLLHQAKIEPGFTELVWQKLEEENQEFFSAYRLRLIVKDQILRFNELLERQAKLMHQICPAGVSSIPMTTTTTQILPLHENSTCTTSETVNHATLLNAYSTMDMAPHSRRISVLPSTLLTQNADVGLMIEGQLTKPEVEAAYNPTNPSFLFGTDQNSVLDIRPAITDAPISSFSSVESNSHTMNEPVLDAAVTSFGFLGQIPRTFSLSDLTADFANSSDIQESYSRSPFLPSDKDSFMDPNGTFPP